MSDAEFEDRSAVADPSETPEHRPLDQASHATGLPAPPTATTDAPVVPPEAASEPAAAATPDEVLNGDAPAAAELVSDAGVAGADVGTQPDDVEPVVAELSQVHAALDRLAETVRGDQDVIGRMQTRIEVLQRDQVRALLGPAVTELADLHAAVVDAASRDFERLGIERARKELSFLQDRVESAIEALGAESLDAGVGDVFDSRRHQAIRQVPTADPAQDKTIATVVRQGFTFDANGKPSLYARVQVHAFDPALAASTADAAAATIPTDGTPDVSTEERVGTRADAALPDPL